MKDTANNSLGRNYHEQDGVSDADAPSTQT